MDFDCRSLERGKRNHETEAEMYTRPKKWCHFTKQTFERMAHSQTQSQRPALLPSEPTLTLSFLLFLGRKLDVKAS